MTTENALLSRHVRYHRASQYLGWATAAVGAVVVLAWMLGIEPVTTLRSGWTHMTALTALTFVLGGGSLSLIAHSSRSAAVTPVAIAAAAAVVLTGLTRLLLYALDIDGARIDALGLAPFAGSTEAPSDSLLAQATAMGFIVDGLALILAARARTVPVAQILALAGGLIGWLGLSQYLFGGESLLPFSRMAAHTAACFLLLSLGILACRPDSGFMRLMTGNTTGGSLSRRLLPAVVLIPTILGWVRLQGEQAGWYGREAGTALFTLATIVFLGILVWLTARLLAGADRRRADTERRLRDQLARLALLDSITRSVAERQDGTSMVSVVISQLEDQLPADFCCMLEHDRAGHAFRIARIGAKSSATVAAVELREGTRITIHGNGLAQCAGGKFVHEPDIGRVDLHFPAQLARAGLRSLTLTPLVIEGEVTAVIVVSRTEPASFSSVDCEFLQQLGEHLSLAFRQRALNASLETAYADLKQAKEAFMHQDRLRMLGQMASGIAHDINNAISPVSMYVQLLRESEQGISDEGMKQLEVIGHGIDDVAATVERIREFYRQREPAGPMPIIDVNASIEQVIEFTRARWNDMPQERGNVITLNSELDRNTPNIGGRANEIREALINLVFNAVDAMPEGGNLTLRTSTVDRMSTNGEQPEVAVCIEVSDDGVGMSDSDRLSCLEPFYSTKGDRGTGLGLSVVYGICQRHGADIEIVTAPGEGTTFRLLFPAADDSEPAAETDAAPEIVSGLRLLVVDDDELVRSALKRILEGDDHRVTTADGGRTGIDTFLQAAASDTPFDAVITDLGMPYVDGRQVAARIKQASPETPVLLLTGWGRDFSAEDGSRPPNVDHVMGKPPRLKDLREALARCVRRGPADAM